MPRTLKIPFFGFGQTVHVRAPDRTHEYEVTPGLPGLPFSFGSDLDPETGERQTVLELGRQWIDAGWSFEVNQPPKPAPTPAPVRSSRPVADLSPAGQAAAKAAAEAVKPPDPEEDGDGDGPTPADA